uniref:Golgin subfamily A conserved domain-containing protein n=1 Tax=Piliocolobus tephrosceles TaxID=591936 RepID=A0A8C9GT73_9PRIM
MWFPPPPGGVECSDVTVPLGTVITAARLAYDLTTQSPKHSRPISGSSGHSTNFQLEGEWGLWDLGVRGPEPRCSDPAGQPSNLLSQWGLGAPLPAETAHTYPSPNDCSLYLFPQSSSNSSSLHAPQSRNQELEVALDSSSTTINQLYENIESLKQQKEQVEHQLEEHFLGFPPNIQFQTINILTLEKADLKTTLYHTKRAARHFEEESKDLAGRLQYSLQRIQELERALSAVSTQQQEEDRSSSRSEAVLQWQLQQTRKERALLNAHVTQVTESLKQVQLQRDEYAQQIKGERARWQERMRKMSMEAHALKEEKQRHIHRIQELETNFSELKHQIAEPPSPVDPAGTSEVEQLQDEAKHLRKEVESLEGKLQFQMENNQQERLRKLLLSQNHKFDKQLAEPQCDLENLNNKNKSALLLEQQVKELQEKLSKVNETVTSAPSKKGWEAGTSLWGGESSFKDLPREKVDGKQQVENLALRFSQLSGATDEPGGRAKHAAPRGGTPLPSGEAAGAARYGVAGCGRPRGPAPGAPAPQELAAAEKQGDFHDSMEPAAGEAREGSPHDNPTAQKILQLLPVMQDTQEHPGLATKPCVGGWSWHMRRRF